MTTMEIRQNLKNEGIIATVKLVNNNFEIRVKHEKNFTIVTKMYPLANVSYTSIK